MPELVARFGGKTGQEVRFVVSPGFLVVRTATRAALDMAPLAAPTRRALDPFERHTRFPQHGVEVLRVRTPVLAGAPDAWTACDAARRVLRRDPHVQFAGRALIPATTPPDADLALVEPIVYTENLFVAFEPGVTRRAAMALLRSRALRVRRRLDWAGHAYFVSAPAGTGLAVFGLALDLLDRPDVALCHPELVRRLSLRRAFAPQWHLRDARVNGVTVRAHAHVAAAWRMSRGRGVTIAVIDDGFDLDHPEFTRRGKIVHARDVTHDDDDPRPGVGDAHGTACAGVACASGLDGASGVAPEARLMPVRLASALGALDEAEAFVWAADHGADVISCSWGPPDGQWWNAGDPTHDTPVPIPDHTRLAIDYAATRGRGALGAVICFAAGNGDEGVEHDGYASHPRAIAIAACNDRSVRSVYSDHGAAIWCAFPSNDYPSHALGHAAPVTPGIWTTDVSGNGGYNPGGDRRRGDAKGHYTSGFGGTSSACAGVAGVAALVLARNPRLTALGVRDLLRHSADPIDRSSGRYDADGHSPFYGYGRVNAQRAVRLAGGSR